MKPWLLIQHVPFEGPGALAPAAARHGIDWHEVHPYRGERIPRPEDLGGFNALVVLGGPMGAHDDADYPSLADERALLAEALAIGMPVLGICLGAQLLAAAAGARVYQGNILECGSGDVLLTPAGRRDLMLSAASSMGVVPVMHWHQDTFDLPPTAVLLAGNDTYAHQAFRIGEHAYGLQFHIEVTNTWIDSVRAELPRGVEVSDEEAESIANRGRLALDVFFARAARWRHE